ncbi:Uncharacterized protein APZ42_025405 [Daphnia magna]|uniref:Uncharacterized protein n=1 Tax=Daphnia magna TaxID=35525 RepID=A0A0P6IJB3_9CRUS|nr:Uncharacterized protein APZ42_025405 [Daphnia magna]
MYRSVTNSTCSWKRIKMKRNRLYESRTHLLAEAIHFQVGLSTIWKSERAID